MKARLALLLLFPFAIACGSGGDQESENPDELHIESIDSDGDGEVEITTDKGSLKIDEDGGHLEIEGDDGINMSVSESGNETLPDGFPTDVAPVYEGGRIFISSRSSEGGKEGFVINYRTEESSEVIKGFYKEAYTEDEIKSDMNMGKASMMTIIKDGYAISVMITPADDDQYGNTSINLTVAPE